MADLMDVFPIVPLEPAGVDCCGCIIVKGSGNVGIL